MKLFALGLALGALAGWSAHSVYTISAFLAPMRAQRRPPFQRWYT